MFMWVGSAEAVFCVTTAPLRSFAQESIYLCDEQISMWLCTACKRAIRMLVFTSSDKAEMLAERCHKLGELRNKTLPIQ
jgi:hypothetical protein